MQPVLKMPDPNAPFAIATDASKYATGGVLMQEDTNGDWKPCAFLSHSLNPAERNYDIYDRELLKVIRALKEWRHHLHGSPHPVKVLTDHKNLTYFRQPQNLNRHQARWLLDLSDFDLQLHHVPGKNLAGPDALSCRPDHTPADDTDNDNVTLLPQSLFVNLIDASLAGKIAASSDSDSVVITALSAIESNMPLPFKSKLVDWAYKGGILTYKSRVYVPEKSDLRRLAVTKHHDHPTAGHPGILKTRQLVSTEFWWPGLASFVRKYVEGCAVCQQNKVNTHPTTPPLVPIPSTATRPFQQVSCDLITDLPSSSGFDSILVMVDHGLTKGVIFSPTTKTASALDIAKIFYNRVYSRFGLYDKIISDRGPQFASLFARELGKLLGYSLSLSTAYHPQTDGETKRVNQELEVYLQIFCQNDPFSQADHLPTAEFTHDHRPHSVTNVSPFYLMYGYEPRPLPSVISETLIPVAEDRIKELSEARKKAIAAHDLACKAMKDRNSGKFVPFAKGDKVWLEAQNLKCLYENRKFAPKREGPFLISEVLSPITYRLSIPSK